MGISVKVRTNEQQSNLNKMGNPYTLTNFLRYIAENSTDSYAVEMANFHLSRMERKNAIRRQQEALFREDTENFLENFITKNLNFGESTTILTIQMETDKIDPKFNRPDKPFSQKKRIYTRPRIQAALEKLVNKGILKESVEYIEGCKNKVKVWTRIG